VYPLFAAASRDRFQTFGPTGEFLMDFGSSGSGPGQFRSPTGLAVDDDGAVRCRPDAIANPNGVAHAADSANHRVVMLSARGPYLAD